MVSDKACTATTYRHDKRCLVAGQEWMLHETHIVGDMKLEIIEAEVKQEKDPLSIAFWWLGIGDT